MGWREKINGDDDNDLTDREIEQALEWVEALAARAGEKAADTLGQIREQQRYLREQERAIEKAWERWDWLELAAEGVVDPWGAEQAVEILARYSP